MAHGAIEVPGLRSRWLRRLGAYLAGSSIVLVLASCGAAEEPGAEPEAAGEEAPAPVAISTYAGTGSPKFKGDGGPAIEAGFFAPNGIALDSNGNLYISSDNRVRRVDALSGAITTLAGTGKNRSEGDGGPATEAAVGEPKGLTVDQEGNVFVVENGSGLVRKIDAATGLITTVAGGGIGDPLHGIFGDGGPATEALVRLPDDVDVDGAGNLYIATDHRVRKVDAVTGIITTVAGTGKRGLGGDEGPATSASLAEPRSVAVDDAGNIFIVDSENHRIRKVDGATGVMTTVAGIGKHYVRGPTWYIGSAQAKEYSPDRVSGEATGAGYSGDGGPATEAMLMLPSGVALDSQGNLFIADGGIRVRRVDAASGIIGTVIAGDSASTYETGKIQVHTGVITEIAAITVNAQGEIFLADFKKNVVHKVSQ